MEPRKIFLGALIAGPVLGTLMGLAANPGMVQLPEPAWRQAQPDPIYTESYRFVDAGPQDLSPTWYLDRMPTWKRREAAREAAEQMRAAEQMLAAEQMFAAEQMAATDRTAAPVPLVALDAPPVTVRIRPSPLDRAADEAADERSAARDAEAGAGSDAHPAIAAADGPAPNATAAGEIELRPSRASSASASAWRR